MDFINFRVTKEEAKTLFAEKIRELYGVWFRDKLTKDLDVTGKMVDDLVNLFRGLKDIEDEAKREELTGVNNE